MTEPDAKLAYMFSPGDVFGDPAQATDYPLKTGSDDSSATETWWWCFHIPERNLNAEVYFWVHTSLGTMSGGVWIFEGIKKHHLQAEHFNFRNYLPRPQLGESTLFCPELNLRINIIEPMQEHEVLYEDPATDTRLILRSTAVMPPVVRSNNAHLDQGMRMTGTLRLRGEDLKIDCIAMRDRSWGKPRPEVPVNHPPTCWCVGITRDGKTAFNFSGCDDPRRNPDVAAYGLTAQEMFKDGWMWRSGELRKIVSLSKLTTRDAGGLQPRTLECTIEDSHGELFELRGEILASVFWSPWPNMAAFFGQLTRWEMGGEVFYGECQEVLWSDCIRKMIR